LTRPDATLLYSSYERSGSRLVGIALVVLLHVALIYALLHALAHRSVTVASVLVETRIIAPTSPQPIVPRTVELPQPAQAAPPPKSAAPPRPIPHHSEMKIEPGLPPPRTAPTAITTVTPPAPPPPPPAEIMPRLDLANSHEPEYPLQSRQLGEQGSVILQVLVGTDGGVLDTKLVQSSGYDRLDQAALREIKSVYRFVPGTVDGKPQPMWYTIKYNWKLR
jgi:protein TonB